MIRSKRYHSLPSSRKVKDRQIFTFSPNSFANDIQFVAMDAAAGMQPPPLVYPGLSIEPFPLLDEQFQVIEPGSDLYLQLNPGLCLDPGLEIPQQQQQQEMYFSENGIPQAVVDEVFQVEDELQLGQGPTRYQGPVRNGLSAAEYEQQLVAEMEKLFPQKQSVPARTGSRLMEELTKISPAEDLVYMSVLLNDSSKKDGRLVPKLDILKRDKERGFRCVDMVDGNGSTFKAKYYEHITVQKYSNVQPPVPATRSLSYPLPHRRVSELLQSTQLTNVSPSMANKIERLANSNNVTLAPVRGSFPTARLTTGNPTSRIVSGVVIKPPKRTVASSSDGDRFPLSKHFPMPIIKQEPLDDFPAPEMMPVQQQQQQQRFAREFNPTRIEIPTISLSSSKQPRKQKLQSLAQCEVVFKETPTALPNAAGGACREATIQKMQQPLRPVRSPNDFVTVTITDSNGNVKKEPQQLRHLQRTFARPMVIDSAPNRPPADCSIVVKKRVTHYRIQKLPRSKRVIGQPVESIEILDSSEEEHDFAANPVQLDSRPEEPPKPKLPGNTESIQCPFCCKIFMSPQSLMEHRRNCADANMFLKDNRKSSSSKEPKKERVSLLLGSRNSFSIEQRNYATNAASAVAEESKISAQNPAQSGCPAAGGSVAKKKRSSASHKRSERLSIEILSSAFNIDNLLVCEVCRKTFRSQDHLELHRKIHDTQFECQYCKRKFHEKPVKHTCQEMKRSVKGKRKTC